MYVILLPSFWASCTTNARKCVFHSALYAEIEKMNSKSSTYSAVVGQDFLAVVLQNICCVQVTCKSQQIIHITWFHIKNLRNVANMQGSLGYQLWYLSQKVIIITSRYSVSISPQRMRAIRWFQEDPRRSFIWEQTHISYFVKSK